MKLFLIEWRTWGYERAIVRAENETEARNLAMIFQGDVTELTTDGEPTVLWQEEHSPDSPRGE